MRAFVVGAILAIATLAAAPPAQACRIAGQLDLNDIEHADVVVVGRISHYERVADQRARERRRQQAQSPDLPPDLRAILEDPTTGFMSDYARFRITVRETLRGEAPRTLVVTWDNSTFDEPPSIASGEYLVALYVRETAPSAGESRFAVLQAPCSPPFLFESNSASARAIRRQLSE